MNRVSDPSSITSADAYIRHKMDWRVHLALGESAALYPSSSCNAGHPPGAWWSPSLVLPLLMLAGYGWSSGRGGRRSKLLLLLSISGCGRKMELRPADATGDSLPAKWNFGWQNDTTNGFYRTARWRLAQTATSSCAPLLLGGSFTAQYF